MTKLFRTTTLRIWQSGQLGFLGLSCVTVLLLAGSAFAQAGDLGRLFFTPEERAAMNRERMAANVTASRAADADTSMESVTFNGHVKRSNGESTIWLNGIAQSPSRRNRIAVTENHHATGEITINPPASRRAYPLKVGQTLTSGNGKIREGYNQAPQIIATTDADRADLTPDTPLKGLEAANN